MFWLLQQIPSATRRKNAHLLYGDLVQSLETLRLRDAFVYHNGIDTLHIGDANQLVYCGVVTLIAIEV